MQYVVTNAPGLPLPGIEYAKPDEVISHFKEHNSIAYDSETPGFRFTAYDMLTFQLGDPNYQFMIDRSTVDIQQFKSLLEEKELIVHNAQFDLKFLYRNKIVPLNIYDSFLAERVLSTGIDMHRKGLDACVKRHLNVEMKKHNRGLIHKRGIFNLEVIDYACEDVAHLHKLKAKQMELIIENNLQNALQLDNKYVPVLAYIAFCGLKIDRDKWKAKMVKDKQVLDIVESELNQIVMDLGFPEFINRQYDLFEPGLKPNINWSSSAQVIKLMKKLGIKTNVWDKKNRKYKDSIEGKHLKKQRGVHRIVDIYLRYQKANKRVTSFGQNVLDMIDPVTGRIHTQFHQIMSTGRLSSGGKNLETGKKTTNLQNWPKKGEERKCAIPGEGNVFQDCDWSGQETRILAEFANDQEYESYISDPEKDLHSFVATLIDPTLKGVSHSIIKEQHADARDAAKPATFSIPYGGNGRTIAENCGLSDPKGEQVYEGFFKEFPHLGEYFKLAAEDAINKGYVLINNITNRKSYFHDYKLFKKIKGELEDMVDDMDRLVQIDNDPAANEAYVYGQTYTENTFLGLTSSFWDLWRREKKKQSDYFLETMKPKFSRYNAMRNSYGRKGQNYRIQGTGADMGKLAGIYFYRWIISSGNWGIVLMNVPLHDEYLTESPEELGHEAGMQLKKAMEDAGKYFCKRIPIIAEPHVGPVWKH